MAHIVSSIKTDNAEYALQLFEEHIPCIVFDVETTGLSKTKDRVTSFSAIRLQKNEAGIVMQTGKLDTLVNPEIPIPEKATELTGITGEMVANAPTYRELAPYIVSFFGEKPFLVSYNGPKFDIFFLRNIMQEVYGDKDLIKPMCHLDVLQLVKEKRHFSRNKLQNVAKEMGVDNGLTFHHSLDDVIATARIAMILLPEKIEGPSGQVVSVTSAKYWDGPAHQFSRIYINTWPRTKSYYDCIGKHWITEPGIDADAIRSEALAMYNIPDIGKREDVDKKFCEAVRERGTL